MRILALRRVAGIEKALRGILGLHARPPRPRGKTSLAARGESLRLNPGAISAHQVLAQADLPVDVDTLTELGDAWLQMGLCRKAVEAYSEALDLDPSHFKACFNRGMANARTGGYQDAAEDFGRAAGIDPEDAAPFANASAALAKLGRHDEALIYAERAVHLDNRNVPSLVNLGAILTHLGRTAEALAVLEKAVAVDPSVARAWYDRACALARLDRPDDATQSLAQACQLDPTMTDRARADQYLAPFFDQEMNLPQEEKPDE